VHKFSPGSNRSTRPRGCARNDRHFGGEVCTNPSSERRDTAISANAPAVIRAAQTRLPLAVIAQIGGSSEIDARRWSVNRSIQDRPHCDIGKGATRSAPKPSRKLLFNKPVLNWSAGPRGWGKTDGGNIFNQRSTHSVGMFSANSKRDNESTRFWQKASSASDNHHSPAVVSAWRPSPAGGLARVQRYEVRKPRRAAATLAYGPIVRRPKIPMVAPCFANASIIRRLLWG